ncbi:MAG: substrate-binding domain-containing protein, partial [Candidatus Omnitrophica bacterium]|nr:substrate-binding domain-containing protein [Candidatus Omnitrophota bacterium]
MNSGKYVVGSIVAGIVLIAGLAALKNGQRAAQWSDEPLILYCAAGMKNPVAAVVKQYADEYGVAVQVNYGGSGTLLSNLRVAQTGDLYLAADETYIEKARELNLVDESIPLAWIEPVIAVPRGNPKKIGSLADLLREDVQVALANPDAAAVGLATRLVLENMGMWEAISGRVKVFKPTVNDIANDLKIGSVDAGVVWDAVAAQYPELDFIRSP